MSSRAQYGRSQSWRSLPFSPEEKRLAKARWDAPGLAGRAHNPVYTLAPARTVSGRHQFTPYDGSATRAYSMSKLKKVNSTYYTAPDGKGVMPLMRAQTRTQRLSPRNAGLPRHVTTYGPGRTLHREASLPSSRQVKSAAADAASRARRRQ